MTKILYRDNKFWLMVDVPEEPINICKHCEGKGWITGAETSCGYCNPGGEWRSSKTTMERYEYQYKACESSAIEISNQEVIKELWWRSDERINNPISLYNWERIILRNNDSFPIPENVEWEIKFNCEYYKPQQIAILKLKSKSVEEESKEEDSIRNFNDDLQYGVQRILRDQGAASTEVFQAIKDTLSELKDKYSITRKQS